MLSRENLYRYVNSDLAQRVPVYVFLLKSLASAVTCCIYRILGLLPALQEKWKCDPCTEGVEHQACEICCSIGGAMMPTETPEGLNA
jgi:hypothetical protein